MNLTKLKKCKCHSYNWDIGEVPNIGLSHPSQEKPILIDACIADDIKRLWQGGIDTENSCCGHGRLAPSVVLADQGDVHNALKMLPQGWHVSVWVRQVYEIQDGEVNEVKERGK